MTTSIFFQIQKERLHISWLQVLSKAESTQICMLNFTVRSTTLVLLKKGQFYLPKDIQQCLEICLAATNGVGKRRGSTNIYHIYQVEAKDAAKHLTTHRTAPQQRITQPQISIVPRLRTSMLYKLPLDSKSKQKKSYHLLSLDSVCYLPRRQSTVLVPAPGCRLWNKWLLKGPAG